MKHVKEAQDVPNDNQAESLRNTFRIQTRLSFLKPLRKWISTPSTHRLKVVCQKQSEQMVRPMVVNAMQHEGSQHGETNCILALLEKERLERVAFPSIEWAKSGFRVNLVEKFSKTFILRSDMKAILGDSQPVTPCNHEL